MRELLEKLRFAPLGPRLLTVVRLLAHEKKVHSPPGFDIRPETTLEFVARVCPSGPRHQVSSRYSAVLSQHNFSTMDGDADSTGRFRSENLSALARSRCVLATCEAHVGYNRSFPGRGTI